MEKIAKIGIVAALLVCLVASVLAFSGQGFGNKGGNEAATAALESGDYESWKAAMIADLTEERFQQEQQRYTEMARRRAEMEAQMTKIQAAIDTGDYTAWKEAVGDTGPESRFAEVVTADNFATYVEMHAAMQSGDFEQAKTLAKELGLDSLGGPGGHGRGMGGPPPESVSSSTQQ